MRPIIKAGDTFELPHEGESWRILSVTADGGPFVAEVTLQTGAGPPLHEHTEEEEQIEVLAGSLSCTLDGRTLSLAAGESITFPAGATHRIWCSTGSSGPVTVRATYSGQAFEALVGELPPGDRASLVRMARHLVITRWAGSRLAQAPLRALLTLIARIGGLFGIRARIEGTDHFVPVNGSQARSAAFREIEAERTEGA